MHAGLGAWPCWAMLSCCVVDTTEMLLLLRPHSPFIMLAVVAVQQAVVDPGGVEPSTIGDVVDHVTLQAHGNSPAMPTPETPM